MERYNYHPLCITRGAGLPVKSNQKMNEYLKEIAIICDLTATLNTHKARRTFGSTVTLKNGVPIHIVKEMMGHHSVKQTEEYAITEQESIGLEMKQLKERLSKNGNTEKNENPMHILIKLQQEVAELSQQQVQNENELPQEELRTITRRLNSIKEMLLTK